ncbi:MAG: response regulator [Deltaproteobacteria bacterium]|jgi:DNA-binding response OmpR family regulator|nr:response regulator [Deltaproteobacteria bacterium]MBW2503739.1 response regulator [Deltaproteobacteria bacterium]
MAHLLVIDDNADIRNLYTEQLKDDGHQVTAAANGDEAMAHLRNNGFDLVVLDIKLDHESGLDLLRQINREDHTVPVILCSAFRSYQDDFSSWLADSYVVKSASLDELKHEIRRILLRETH